MIPTGLRVRPQFNYLLTQLNKEICRPVNRSARQLRNGFVFSQYDAQNVILAEQQQLNIVNIQSQHNKILATAMAANVPPASFPPAPSPGHCSLEN